MCTAEDTHNGRHLDMREICLLESHRGKHNQKNNHTRTMKDLPYQIEIALGMKIMITDNIQTDLDITNGATGEIIDIILHEDESIQSLNDTIITLKHLPIYILVKLGRTRATKLYNLEDCIVPIEPTSTTYRIKITTQNGNIVQRTIQRRQFPLTGAYAYTDYRSQGQTIQYAIIDIAPPPCGTLTLFNLYVAFSRCCGRDSIRLLRDFDDEMLLSSHDIELLNEDARLESLNKKTLEWYNDLLATR